jgi:hypothetical protein
VSGIDALAGTPCHVGSPTPGTLQVDYDAAGRLSLTCSLPAATLTVTKSGSGSGTVSSGSEIGCGALCTHAYPVGTSVTLSAQPDAFMTFVSWHGACTGSTPTCTLSITSNVSVEAEFEAPGNLGIQVVGGLSGYLLPGGTWGMASPDGSITGGVVAGIDIVVQTSGFNVYPAPDCIPTPTAPCQFAPGPTSRFFTLPAGTSVTLSATSRTGVFTGWGGACAAAGVQATCTVTLGTALTVVSASFECRSQDPTCGT